MASIVNVERDKRLDRAVAAHYHECENKYGEGNVWVTMLYGSQNYGLDTPDSDVDTKTMLLPSVRGVVLGKPMVSTDLAMPDGALSNTKDFRAMFQNYLKGNINFVETLYTTWFTCNEKYYSFYQRLRNHRDLVANSQPRRLAHMSAGMANQKYVAFEKPFESKKEVLAKYGYDPKQLHHLARLRWFLHTYNAHMDFEFALTPPRDKFDWLYSLKVDPLPYDKAKDLKETLMAAINDEVAYADSFLPEENRRQEAQDFMDDLTVSLFNEMFWNGLLGTFDLSHIEI